MPTIGFSELIIILIVALLIFGPKAIPGIGKSIGEGIREFKKASKGLAEETDKESKDTPS